MPPVSKQVRYVAPIYDPLVITHLLRRGRGVTGVRRVAAALAGCWKTRSGRVAGIHRLKPAPVVKPHVAAGDSGIGFGRAAVS